jgi:hypothetical protein
MPARVPHGDAADDKHVVDDVLNAADATMEVGAAQTPTDVTAGSQHGLGSLDQRVSGLYLPSGGGEAWGPRLRPAETVQPSSLLSEVEKIAGDVRRQMAVDAKKLLDELSYPAVAQFKSLRDARVNEQIVARARDMHAKHALPDDGTVVVVPRPDWTEELRQRKDATYGELLHLHAEEWVHENRMFHPSLDQMADAQAGEEKAAGAAAAKKKAIEEAYETTSMTAGDNEKAKATIGNLIVDAHRRCEPHPNPLRKNRQ